MEAIETMITRRSVRGFVPDKMPEQTVIDRVAEAGTYAPSGMGRQSAIIVEVTNKAVRDRLSELNAAVMGTKADPFYGAPAVLIVLADRNAPTHLYDGSLVIGNLLNAAHAVGLGSCWIHRAKEIFDSAEGKQMLKDWGVTGDYEGIGFCALGYPLKDPKEAAPRKPNFVYRVK
jgi:nitroreductase